MARKASDEQISAAYERHGSCKKAAASLGMCGQSVHERLTKLGINKPINVFTEDEKARLLRDYSSHADAHTVDALAADMGRTRQFICRQARALGLTSQRRKVPQHKLPAMADRTRAMHAEQGHPRGMLGKLHNAATKVRISEHSLQRWGSMTIDERSELTMKQLRARAAAGSMAPQRPGASWKAGWREVGGKRIYFRSRWEANYGRYLEWLRSIGQITAWEHEPEVFWFEKIKRGCRSYLPDFKVTENSGAVAFHEVKGWMDDRSKTKIKRMRIYHPKVSLIVIDGKQYAEISRKVSALVPEWEA